MTALPVRTIDLPSGEAIPVLGLGTWGFGEDPGRRAAEIATLRDGVAVGLTLIDNAELHGGGRSEEVVGEAIDGRRDGVFRVSKVLPLQRHADGHDRGMRAQPAPARDRPA